MNNADNFAKKHPIIAVVVISGVCFFLSLLVLILCAGLGFSREAAEKCADLFASLSAAGLSCTVLVRVIRLELKKNPPRRLFLGLYGFLVFNFALSALMSIAALF